MAIVRYIKNPPIGPTTSWTERELEAIERTLASISESSGATTPMVHAYIAAFTPTFPNTVSFDAARWDTGSFWSGGSPTLITIPSNGVYEVKVCYNGEASNGTLTQFTVAIQSGGTEFAPYMVDLFWTKTGELQAAGVVSGLLRMNAAETITVVGASTTATTFTGTVDLTIVRLSDLS